MPVVDTKIRLARVARKSVYKDMGILHGVPAARVVVVCRGHLLHAGEVDTVPSLVLGGRVPLREGLRGAGHPGAWGVACAGAI